MVTCSVVAIPIEQSPHKPVCKPLAGTRSTALDRIWPHEEGNGGEFRLANIRKQTQRYWRETRSRSIMLCFWKDFRRPYRV
jgi:hypothetical protein